MNKRKYFNLRTARRTKVGRIITTSLFTSIIVFILLFTYLKVIESYANKVVATSIRTIVKQQSNGRYDIKYGSLTVDVLKNSVDLKNVSLAITGDSVTINSEDKIFEISANEIILDVQGLWSIWLDDKLDIENVTVNRPIIKITSRKKKGEAKFARETGNLIKQLKEYVTELNIKNMDINHAAINFYQNKIQQEQLFLKIPDLTLILKGFSWESDDTFSELNTDALYVNLKNQEFLFPDSTALVSVEDITYTLKKNTLTFKNAVLKPLIKSSEQDSSSLQLVEMSFQGINLKEAYENNTLLLDTVIIVQPQLRALSEFNFLSSSIQKKDSSKSVIDSLYVSNLKLIKGSVDTGLTTTTNNLAIVVSELDFEVSKLAVGGQNEGALNYEKTNLALFDVEGKINQNNHHFSFDQFNYSSDSEKLSIDSLRIWPDASLAKEELRISFEIPGLFISGINEQELFEDRITIDTIQAQKVSVDISDLRRIKNKVEAGNKLPTLVIENTVIAELNLAREDRSSSVKIKRGNVTLANLRLEGDSLLIDSTFYFDSALPFFSFNKKNGSLVIMAYNTKGSSFSKTASIARLSVTNPTLKVIAEQVVIDNTTSWMETRPDSLHFNFLSFTNYSITVKPSKNKDISDATNILFAIDSVNATSGQIEMTLTENQSIKTRADTLILNNVAKAEETLEIQHYAVILSDLLLKEQETDLTVDQLTAHSESEYLQLKNIEIAHQKDSLKQKVSVASLTLSDLNLHLFPQDLEVINLGSLRITNAVYESLGEDKSKKLSSPYFWSKEWPKVLLKDLTLVNGKYESQGFDNRYSLSGINVKLSDIELSESITKTNFNPTGLLYAQSINGKIDTVSLTLRNRKINGNNLLLNEDIAIKNLIYEKWADSLQIDIPSVELKQFAYNELLSNQLLRGTNLTIGSPIINGAISTMEDPSDNSPNISIDLDKVNVTDATLDVTTKENQRLNLSPITITLTKLYYDSLTDLSTTLIPAETIELNTADLRYVTADGLNEITIGNLGLSNKQKEITLNKVNIKPLFGKEEYMEISGFQTDWIEAQIPSIKVRQLDIRRFLNKRALIATDIIITEPVINVFRDKNFSDLLTVEKKLPAQLLLELESKVDIDSLHIKNAAISYSETPEKGELPGEITFETMEATLYNITNLPEIIAKDSITKLQVTAKVMGEVPVKVGMKFNLLSKEHKFVLSGEVAPHEIGVFNRFTKDGAFIYIKSGSAKSLNFTAFADDNLAFGDMYFRYTDFKIALVDKQTADTKKFEESIASFMANTFLVKKRNMSILRLRKGTIYYERNKNKSIFNYLSKMFTSGVASSVGFQQNKKEIRELKKSRSSK